MINIFEVNETNKMIEQENLDVRTITMGISLLDCIDPDLDALNQKYMKRSPQKPEILWQQVMRLLPSTDPGCKQENLSNSYRIGWRSCM